MRKRRSWAGSAPMAPVQRARRHHACLQRAPFTTRPSSLPQRQSQGHSPVCGACCVLPWRAPFVRGYNHSALTFCKRRGAPHRWWDWPRAACKATQTTAGQSFRFNRRTGSCARCAGAHAGRARHPLADRQGLPATAAIPCVPWGDLPRGDRPSCVWPRVNAGCRTAQETSPRRRAPPGRSRPPWAPPRPRTPRARTAPPCRARKTGLPPDRHRRSPVRP